MVLTNWKEVFQQERKPYWLSIPNTSRHSKIRHTLSDTYNHCLAPSLQCSRPVCFPPCPLSMLSRAGSVVLERQRLGPLTGALKDRRRQGFTQSNPDPSAASEPFCPPWPSSPPLPAGLPIPETSAPGCSSTGSPQPGMFLHLFPLEADVPYRCQRAFLIPGKSKSLLRGYCSRGALPST